MKISLLKPIERSGSGSHNIQIITIQNLNSAYPVHLKTEIEPVSKTLCLLYKEQSQNKVLQTLSYDVNWYLACPCVVFECVLEHLSSGLWHTDNMGISGEVLCHIPNSNVFVDFLSECKPCHTYDNDEILVPPLQDLAECWGSDSKLLSFYFYGTQNKKAWGSKLKSL